MSPSKVSDPSKRQTSSDTASHLGPEDSIPPNTRPATCSWHSRLAKAERRGSNSRIAAQCFWARSDVAETPLLYTDPHQQIQTFRQNSDIKLRTIWMTTSHTTALSQFVPLYTVSTCCRSCHVHSQSLTSRVCVHLHVFFVPVPRRTATFFATIPVARQTPGPISSHLTVAVATAAKLLAQSPVT